MKYDALFKTDVPGGEKQPKAILFICFTTNNVNPLIPRILMKFCKKGIGALNKGFV